MKRILIILWAGFMGLLMFSCYNDEGSYDYHEINEVNISNWVSGGYTMIYHSDTLRITPQLEYDSLSTEPYIEFTMDEGNLDRYEIVWQAVQTNVASDEVPVDEVIGTELNLVYPVSLKPGNYYLYLKIKDKETDLLWMSQTSLQVLNATDMGFLLLGEKEDGNVGLDMISFATDTLILKDLLVGCGLPELQGPVRVMYTGTYIRNTYLWISTESGSYYLDPTTMQGTPENTFNAFVVSVLDMPDNMVIQDMNARYWYSPNTMNRVFIAGGNVFACQLGMGELYANPVNCYSATDMDFFEVFPYIFANNYWRPGSYVVYDETNHRFVYFSNGLSTTCLTMTDGANDQYSWQQPEDRELIYGENSFQLSGYGTYSYALLEDAENFYLYQFLFPMSGRPNKSNGATIPKSTVPDMKAGQLFAFSSTMPVMLYADGSTLHAYNYAYNRSFSMEMDGEITCMEFDVTGANYDEIMIATYNDTEKGVVQRFRLETDLTQFLLTPLDNCRWTGLVRVKDIEWRQ